jgi:hypothetical protein
MAGETDLQALLKNLNPELNAARAMDLLRRMMVS